MSFPEDQFIAISALQHWLFCPRQCALIHLEQAWADNRFTAEGNQFHEKAHDGADETKSHVRITRGMPVSSAQFGIAGQCDVVEFHPVSLDEISLESTGKFPFTILPVEYKRGKPKAHRADEVQLCAQAICLEEMLSVQISHGCLFYGEKRRRFDILFDTNLRQCALDTIEAVRRCFTSRKTPLADYEPKRCDSCSLIDHCKPKAMRFKKGAAAWFSAQLQQASENP